MTDTPSTDLDVVSCTVPVDLPAAECWRHIGAFADAGRFLDVASRLVAGDGGIGSIRQIGDAILEAMVGQTDLSYTYVQTVGPMAAFLYHGCVALTATGPDSCTLAYTISYDQASMDAARRQAEHARIAGRFQGAAETMKRVAEHEAAD